MSGRDTKRAPRRQGGSRSHGKAAGGGRRSKARALSATGGGGAGSTLGFQMQSQGEKLNWCWAAVATSTSLFYDSQSRWTQCKVANRYLGTAGCCGSGGEDCDQTGELQEALRIVGRFWGWDQGVVKLAGIASELDARRPLCARVEWDSGGGHFVVIDGYEAVTGMITVKDPKYGTSTMAYDEFVNDYRNSGFWTHTYWTI